MILHRLAVRLKQQDWTAVAIEFVLVVAGVFVGIQVANWNEERKERALETAYLARIAEDVRNDVVELNEVIKFSTLRMALMNDLETLVGASPGLPRPCFAPSRVQPWFRG